MGEVRREGNENKMPLSVCARSYPSREKTARFLTADVEELIRECTSEKERLTAELKNKLKQLTDADVNIKKSSQVNTHTTVCAINSNWVGLKAELFSFWN